VLETVIDPEVRDRYLTLTDEERDDLDRVLQLLELNPWTDNVTKFTATFRGRAVGIYDDGRWEVAYRLVDDRFLEIVGSRGWPDDPMNTAAIRVPLERDVAGSLRAGEQVTLTGSVYTARDAAHRRMAAATAKGEALPVDLRGETIYYVGPTPAREGRVIGAAGPTTAVRMDPFTVPLLEQGLLAMIGKGDWGAEVRAAIARHGAVYFMAVGGSGALLSRHIRAVEVVAYEDLGTEAIRRMELDEFPVIVACDAAGGNLFEDGRAAYRRADVLGRYGR
jgi:fumarate hydratase subunit beta